MIEIASPGWRGYRKGDLETMSCARKSSDPSVHLFSPLKVYRESSRCIKGKTAKSTAVMMKHHKNMIFTLDLVQEEHLG